MTEQLFHHSLTTPSLRSLARLPMSMRLLCIAETEPDWTPLTLRLGEAGCHEPCFRWTSRPTEAIGLLRCESFDAVIFDASNEGLLKEGKQSLQHFVQAVRTGGCEDAVLVMTAACPDSCWSDLAELHCEILVTDRGWTSAALTAALQKCLYMVDLGRENYRLGIANQRRLSRERDEASHLLEHQRRIIDVHPQAIRLTAGDSDPCSDGRDRTDGSNQAVPNEVRLFYRELLRNYVIMGSGSLSDEIGSLAELLANAGVSPREVLDLHVEGVTSMVRGLGQRSARHVLSRADLLALELMLRLAEYLGKSATGTLQGVTAPQQDSDQVCSVDQTSMPRHAAVESECCISSKPGNPVK